MTRLAELMEQKKISISRLAKESGIPERTVYRHVRGETSVSLLQASAYAAALGVGIEELAGERVRA